MQRSEFEQLCRDASLELGLEDTASLGRGFTVAYEDVLFETAYRDGRDDFVLLTELGAVEEEQKQRVYESLLTLQVFTWNQPSLRFGFNPARSTVMLGVQANLAAHANGAWLADMVRSAAAQATRWRGTLLAGRVAEADFAGALGK